MNSILFVQTTLFIPTFATTTKFFIMITSLKIWQWNRNARILYLVLQETCFGLFVRIAPLSDSNKRPKHVLYVLWRNKNITRPFLHIIPLDKNTLQKLLHFNDAIFVNTNAICHCNEGALKIYQTVMKHDISQDRVSRLNWCLPII